MPDPHTAPGKGPHRVFLLSPANAGGARMALVLSPAASFPPACAVRGEGAALGERLLFPVDFVGRGDMSRGGLMLRAAREGTELAYGRVLGAVRRGTRPPRLPPLR